MMTIVSRIFVECQKLYYTGKAWIIRIDIPHESKYMPIFTFNQLSYNLLVQIL